MSFSLAQQAAKAALTRDVQLATEELIEDMRVELAAQGHNLTGSLSRSLEAKLADKVNLITSEILMFAYGRYQDQGVSKRRIPFGRAQRFGSSTRSKFIEGLRRWVKARGITNIDKRALSIAFAIAKKMKKEGMPTRGAYKFSRNGRRKGFVSFTHKRLIGRTTDRMSRAAENFVNTLVDGSLNGLQDKYPDVLKVSV